MEDDTSSSPQPGGDDTTEMSENDASSIVPDVIPLEDYNIKKAKLKASLKWMVVKAYTKYEPPPDLKEPFFQDAEGEEHLKPSVIYQLASSELYSMASTNVFPPTLHQWQGHWSIIQGLSRKGVYVVDDKEQPVTETVLAQTQRIKLSAHLAMMDAIQRAYVAEVASIEKVVQAVRQISTFSASSELPFDVEDGLLFWMNKVCGTVRHQMDKERKNQQASLMQGSPQKVRIRREQLQTKDLPSIPVMDDLMKDLGDGCCLAVLLHFYFPHLMSLDDLSLQDPMSFAESIHNLGIIEEFFQQHLPKMYPFKPEDLLYSPACLKSNVLAMLGELFYTCEASMPQHLKKVKEHAPKIVSAQTPDSISSKLPPLPISSATKKSFQNDMASNLARNTSSNPELNKIAASPQLGQQPLLPRRHKQVQGSVHLDNGDDSLQSQLRRASSLDNIDVGKSSFVAWVKPEERLDVSSPPVKSLEPIKSSLRDSQASSLLTNVSLDSDLGQSINIDELNESQNRPLQVESRPGTYTMPEYVDEDDLEVESLTSALSRVSRASENVQPQSLDGAPAVAGDDAITRQSQYNGTKEVVEPSLDTLRTDQPSEAGSYVSDSQASLGYTLGGSSGNGHEQLESSNNFHRKKLTLDIQPVPIGQSRGRHQEKLMPAVVRPLKEKSQNANKQEERGVLSQSRSPRHMGETNSKLTSWGKPGNNDLSPDLEPSTPLSPESIADSLASDFSQRNKDNVSQQKSQYNRVPFQPLNQNISQEPQMTKGKNGEAFYIHADPDQNIQYQDNVHDSMEPTRPHPTSSFTIVDKQYTMESAQQAGIPVVSSMDDGLRSWSHPTRDTVNSGGGGGSPRISQSNAFSHSYPANPNHMQSPHMTTHSYHSPSHSHNSSPMHTPPPQLHTPPPPPPGNPNYPNPHYHPNLHHSPQHPHHSPQHSSPQHSPHHHYPTQHASPIHGHHPHSIPQYAGLGGGSSGVGGGRVELTRFGNPGMEPSSVTLTAPERNGEKESPKLHADQTERESAFRAPVLLTFDSNLSPEKPVDSPVDSTSNMSHSQSNHINHHSHVDANSPRFSSPEELTSLPTKASPPLLSNHVQMDVDPLDTNHVQMDADPLDEEAYLINQKSDPNVVLSSDYITTKPHSKMTTWVSHSKHAPHINDINTGHGAPSHHHNNQEPLAVGLAQVRLRLEEKRRNMEKEKRTLERHSIKHRQRVGKAAFLQVLANQKRAKEPEHIVHNAPEEGSLRRDGNRPYSREEIERSLQDAQSKWLQEPANPGKTTFAALSAHKEKSSGSVHSRDSDSPSRGLTDSPASVVEVGSKGSPGSSSGSHTPPHMTPEQYNVSLDKMNENMSQLMREIQKISLQQEQLKASIDSPRQPDAKESPRQQASKPSTGRQLSSSSSGSDAPGFMLHGNGGAGGADNQPFFLGTKTPSPPGPPPVESENEPFVLQENPLFSMSEQMSPPNSRPVGGHPAQSPQTLHPGGQGSPREGHDTYVVQKPKSRPKLHMSATESLASKRGQQITPVETNIAKSAGSEAPMTLDDLDKSPPNQGFRLHGSDPEPESDTQVVQANNSYKAPVGFEIVDDEPKPTAKKPTRERHTPQQQVQQKHPEKVVPRRRNNSVGSPTKKRPPSVYEIVGETEEGQEEEVEPMVVKPLDESTHDIDDSGDSKVLGFMVAEEKNEEDEIAKRREQFLRSRLKKQESEKAKKAAREAQTEKLKEEHRRKQEEVETKKAKEIERREKIRLAYQKRKQKEKDEQDGGPPPMREKKTSKKSRPRSRIIDENTDFAKPTISSGPPAVSAQDVAEANMPISKQKTSFTISSSNGHSERSGGGASGVTSGPLITPNQPLKAIHPPGTTTPTTAPAGLSSNAMPATSPEKPPSVPDAVRRRPPSPRLRQKQNGTKHADTSPTKRGPSPAPSGPLSERPSSGRFDDTQSTTAPSIVSQDNSSDSGGSGQPEYTGPKLYVKPTSKSNRHIITNAIAHCVLAGVVNQGNKDKVLQEVAKSDFKHFVLLFRNSGLQFRGLYGYSPDSDEITKIYGTGPRHVTPKMIEGLYKYNSGDKSFSKIPSKTMSVQIDGIVISNHLWQNKKPSAKKH